MISPQNGGRINDLAQKWGECRWNSSFLGGVYFKCINFGGSVVPFYENLGEAKKIMKKKSRMGVGRYLNKINGGR